MNSTGLEQARLMGERVQHWKPDVILCSDLTRAKQTAEGAQKFWQAPVVYSDQLREMNLGKAEGLHRNDVMKLVGPDWTKWISPQEGDENFGFPGGETKAQTRTRVLKFIENYCRQNPQHKRIAVSTHGGVLRRVTHGLEGIPADGIPIPNCVTYRLRYENNNWSFIPDRKRASTIVLHEEKLLTFLAVDPMTQQNYHFVPGGVMEEAEDPIACAHRETWEETGYTVKVDPAAQISVEYDFTWNGQARWCRTDFFRAHLVGDFFEPRPIKDASYHKGVVWLPAESLNSFFNYSDPILSAVSKLK